MTEPSSGSDDPLLETPLHGAHVALGARMVPFAGYAMPVQYPSGIIAEHTHTRAAAGLFDVSHMGQASLRAANHAAVAAALEALVPADILGLAPGRQRYSQLLNADGGILDDLMVSRPADPAADGTLALVVNASRKAADFALLRERLAGKAELLVHDDRALLALQGPEAAAVMAMHCPPAAALPFMGVATATIDGIAVGLSRSGYTGEDGFEISVGAGEARALWDRLTADPRVRPIGLGARDSLRLEAGLCLYGHDIDETTSPVEAGLTWSIQKRRREAGGFPGAVLVRRELEDGPARLRIGLRPEGRAPVREGAVIKNSFGDVVGSVTSGGFGPSLGAPVAMGYVLRRFAEPGTALTVDLRGKDVPATVVPLPFVPHRYKKP
ncbi:glycine cleavage system aminomethyltransferase GcvT [Labrys wisconsinensis]|uniref:aminomethyltransferase n=1 Tax=Labrys wisconsinensis TaxID=425677 RepID=A0ABU0J7Y3_9HYPH|nr:glycine cleavage system aminomethyltransferase GcvT [Labrys wisconsinensis]MDQ0470382.1 aminomethyltransferase [Labrys wisconsinensis]